jgi:hypothetical protein
MALVDCMRYPQVPQRTKHERWRRVAGGRRQIDGVEACPDDQPPQSLSRLPRQLFTWTHLTIKVVAAPQPLRCPQALVCLTMAVIS